MPKIITEMALRHKGFLEASFLPAVILLVGISAFGLGRLSATVVPNGRVEAATINAVDQAPLKPATYVPAPTPLKPKTVDATVGQYVASKSGTKYYLPNCSGVSRIKEENKVWVESVADAIAAGYSAAANCPGL